MAEALLHSSIRSLPLLARGKVRDNYAVGNDRILMVASDRLSAFDVIMGEPIPGKGEILTRMARVVGQRGRHRGRGRFGVGTADAGHDVRPHQRAVGEGMGHERIPKDE